MLSGQLALVTSALFAGTTLYVNVVEQPPQFQTSWHELKPDDKALLTQWKPVYKRKFAMQAPLTIIGFMLGALAAWQTGNWLWLVGGIVLAANLPCSELRLNKLKWMDWDEIWGQLHAVQSALGIAATLIFLVASLE